MMSLRSLPLWEEDLCCFMSRAVGSAPGPDGLPYSAWAAAGVHGARTLALLEEHLRSGLRMPFGFNALLKVFLPTQGEKGGESVEVIRAPEEVGLLGLSNTDNKLICGVRNHRMRGAASRFAVGLQRGFVSGRQLVQNPIDFDSAARSIGHPGTVANIPILAFWGLAAAFPSAAHLWLFKVLVHIAFPRGFIGVARGVYSMTGAYGVGEEGLRLLFWILSGVIPGCPFSGMLFVFVLDPFLHAVEILLDMLGHSTTRACADDIGAAITSLQHLRVFFSLFKVLRWSSDLRLSPPRCVIIPIAVEFSQEMCDQMRAWLALRIPEWSDFRVCPGGKYLGFLMGPAVDMQSWLGPLSKWSYRVDLISRAGVALSIGARLYNGRALPVLGYVAQLVPARPRVAS